MLAIQLEFFELGNVSENIFQFNMCRIKTPIQKWQVKRSK